MIQNHGWKHLHFLQMEIFPEFLKERQVLRYLICLIAAAQNFSSSFQVRFGQFGYCPVSMITVVIQGHNFDDIRIYEAIDDIQLLSIDEPLTNKCSFNECRNCNSYGQKCFTKCNQQYAGKNGC